MGHRIPVFYAVCDPHDFPAEASSWKDAESFLSQAFGDRSAYGLYSATARNWWQIQAITDVRDREGLSGLGFCDREFIVLSGDDLPLAIQSLARVITAHQEMENIAADDRTFPTFQYDIDCEMNNGFDLFLRSLLHVLQKARNKGKSFVFIQPQP